MKLLKAMLKGILYCIGALFFIVVTAVVSIILYVMLSSLIIGRGDYLLVVTSSRLEIVPIVMITVLIMYGLIKLKKRIFPNKLEKELLKAEENGAYGTLTDKLVKITRYCYIPVLVIVLYICLASKTTVYKDSIKVTYPNNLKGITYSYSDVKSINVGFVKDRGDYRMYYKINFSNNKSVDLYGGNSMAKADTSIEDELIKLDNNFRNLGIPRSIDKSNYESFSKEKNENIISNIDRVLK